MSAVVKDPERDSTTKLPRSMRRSRSADTRARAHGIVALALLLAMGTAACNPGAPSSSDETPASAQLAALVEEAWGRQIEENPFARIREGLPVSELPPFSYDSAEADAIYAQSLLDRLDAIDAAQLEHEDVLTAEILRWQASMQVEGLQYYWLRSLLTPYVNPLPGLQRIFAAQPLDDLQDLDNYLRLLEQVSPWVRSLYETVRSQAARGFVTSRANMPAVIAVTRAAIKPAVNHPLAPSGDRLSAFATEDAQAFELELGDIIEREINPAIEELAEYLEGEYLELAPDGVGVRQYPNGEDYYRYLARLTTTMEVTPEEVQQVGFDMVEQMQQEMAAIQTEIGFEGTAAEFREYLRDDARFYPETPDEVGERLLRAADRFYERIDDYFLVVPEAPYGVRRLDPALEGSQTYGYYSPPTPADPKGYYNYNGSDLDQRSWLNLEGVAFHELIPGHHFHIARQYENESLPPMRRYTLPTAFTEGWGSYASYLGLEAGMYDDAYSRYGMYILEIFLATRLVVDPGMNYFGWSLEQARDFMRESTFESETQIATESLRYSTDMPAQALAYQMGKRKILELRARAEAELGDAFDLRRFHEAILGSGAMPMTVLEQHIDWWIACEQGDCR